MVDHSEKLDLGGSLTLLAEARLNHTGSSQGGQPLIGKGDTSYALKVSENGKDLEFYIYSAGAWHNVTAKLPADAASRFHTYAGVYDRKSLALYVDGKAAASKPCSLPVSKNNFELAVGIDTEETARRLNGSVRRAAVYARALGENELAKPPADAELVLDFAKDAEKPKTIRFLAYGGDFNDRPTDLSFCSNGLVRADLSPSPQFEEVRKVYQNIHTTPVDVTSPTVKIQVHNEQFFQGLESVRGSWKLMRDGIAVAEGKLTLPEIAPQQKAVIEVATGHAPDASSEYFLRVRYDLVSATAWHPAGMPIAWDEMPLPWGKRTPARPAVSESPASFTETDGEITLRGGEVSVVIGKSRGSITSLNFKNEEMLRAPLQLNFWRPPTNNDEGAKLHHKLRIWQYAGARATAGTISAARDGMDVVVTAELQIPAKQSSATIRYRLTGNGQLAVETEFRPDKELPMIPKIGFQCEIPASFEHWKWHGKGPFENHIDRQAGSWTSMHEGLVPDLFHHYIDPQEAGNRTGIRWATLSSPSGGMGLRVDATGESLLEMSCYPCAAADIQLAMHSTEIPKRDLITLNLDHRNSGVGGTNSWGALALPKYLIQPGKIYQWSFLLTPSAAAER